MRSDAPLLYFQKITDAILAFWGCVDDQIDDENTRNIIKIGKRVERLDLYARLKKSPTAIRREINRLAGRISRPGAERTADAVERFMICNGMLAGTPSEAEPGRIFRYDDLLNVRTSQAGLYNSLADNNDHVSAGQALAEIIDPCTGEVLEILQSHADGIVFFQHNNPLIYSFTSAFKILRDV